MTTDQNNNTITDTTRFSDARRTSKVDEQGRAGSLNQANGRIDSEGEFEEQPAIIELANLSELRFIEETDISNQQADLYIWESEQAESTEEISHFVPGNGGDLLQLNDLHLKNHERQTLDQYLHFSYDGKDTIIDICPDGIENKIIHHLVLHDVALTMFGNNDNQIIQQLFRQGNLDIVGAA